MGVQRRKEGGRIWCWQLRDQRWPGQRHSLQVEGLELILTSTPWPGAPTQSWSCYLEDFLTGSFHDIIRDSFGDKALQEALDTARASLPAPAPARVSRTATPRPSAGSTLASKSTSPLASAAAPARQAVRKVVRDGAAEPAPARLARKGLKKLTPAASGASQVGVALTECPQVNLSTAVTLKALLGIQSRELKKKLGSLPAQLTDRISRKKAEQLQQRLEALGARVILTA